jgi:hypothetical protein
MAQLLRIINKLVTAARSAKNPTDFFTPYLPKRDLLPDFGISPPLSNLDVGV